MTNIKIGTINVTLFENFTTKWWFKINDVTIPIPFTKELHLMLTLPDDSQVGFVLAGGIDRGGNPTVLSVPPVVTVSDSNILTVVQPDPATPDNPLSGVLSATGALGTAQMVITDTDPTAGVLSILVDVTVIASATVNLQQPTFGPVTPKVVPTV
jgi:hypothetical protein